MTRDEYILLQFKDNIALNHALFIGEFIVGIGGVLLMIAGLVMGKGAAVLGILPLIIFFFGSGFSARLKEQSFIAGLAEIEADPVNIAEGYRFSQETAKLIASVQVRQKDLFGMVFAYGIVALMCIAGGIVIIVIAEESLVLIAAGAITLTMGLGLTVLTIKSFRNWRITKKLNESQSA